MSLRKKFSLLRLAIVVIFRTGVVIGTVAAKRKRNK